MSEKDDKLDGQEQGEEETLFEFPCEFPIKAMGRATPEMEIAVMEIMNRHVPDLGEGAVKMRESSKGNYVAITVTITARSKQQLDAIYMELSSCEHIAFSI